MARVQEIYPCSQHFHLMLMVFRWNQLYTSPKHHKFDNLRMTLNNWLLENSKQLLNTIGIQPVVHRPKTSVFDNLRMRLINQPSSSRTAFPTSTVWFASTTWVRFQKRYFWVSSVTNLAADVPTSHQRYQIFVAKNTSGIVPIMRCHVYKLWYSSTIPSTFVVRIRMRCSFLVVPLSLF